MKYFLFLIVIILNGCSRKNEVVNESNSAFDEKKGLAILYTKIFPAREPHDSVDLNLFFKCTYNQNYSNIHIITASYYAGYDSRDLTCTLLSEGNFNSVDSCHYITSNYNYLTDCFQKGYYASGKFDSIINQISSLQKMNYDSIGQFISKLMVLTTVAANRVYYNGCDLGINYNLAMMDFIPITKENLEIITKDLENLTSVTEFYNFPFEFWKGNIFSKCCFGVPTQESYELSLADFRNHISERKQQIDIEINTIHETVLRNVLPYVIKNIDDKTKYFYYTIPDLQVYEISTIKEGSFYKSKLRLLNPNIIWRKSYIPNSIQP